MKLFEILNEQFIFDLNQVGQLWADINKVCFNNKLNKPPIYIEPDLNHLVPPEYADKFGSGDVLGYCDEDPETKEIVLLVAAKMHTAIELMQVVAHEMVHQALAEKYGYQKMLQIGHGQEFIEYANSVKKYHNTVLHGASYPEQQS